jgi:hypothetical protein
METHFGEKMVSINGNGFPLKGDGFPLQGNFGQDFKSCLQPKIWNFFEKFLRFFSNYMCREHLYAKFGKIKHHFFLKHALFFKNGFHK